MYLKSRCIALRTVRHKDESAIAACLTREGGLMSFVVPDGKGRGAVRRRAIMMPGSGFEAEIDLREGRSLQRMSDLRPTRMMLSDNPAKGVVAMWMCDMLSAVLREQQSDSALFDFVDFSLDTLMESNAIGNFPIAFLIGLSRFLGIEPDRGTWRQGRIFNMDGGVWSDTPPLLGRWLDRDESAAAATLMNMSIKNMTVFRLTHEQRRRGLDVALDYYAIHLGRLSSMKSLEVIRDIFG